MKALTFALTLAFASATGTAYADTMAHDMDMGQHQIAPQAAAEATGVIKELDANASRIKIAHGPINALHWPPMTMWFGMRGTLPPTLKAGERVHFALEQAGPDEWVITRIELQR